MTTFTKVDYEVALEIATMRPLVRPIRTGNIGNVEPLSKTVRLTKSVPLFIAAWMRLFSEVGVIKTDIATITEQVKDSKAVTGDVKKWKLMGTVRSAWLALAVLRSA